LAAEENTNDDDLRRLVLAADQFVIEESDVVARATVIAGYPWFTDWGRDTMISLPGLTLATGRLNVAKSILEVFADAIEDGLLPNRFTDGDAGADYNTVDATLWFFHAAYEYARVANDWDLLTGVLLPHFEDVLKAHIEGTKYGIKVDPEDGLLYAGQPGVQLTWMDAKVGDWVVTPRIGKPVEIQALWFNALSVTALVVNKAGNDGSTWQSMADRARSSFLRKFVNPDTGALYDVVDGPNGAGSDASIRPNQIFALSLPFHVVDPTSATGKAVFKTVTDHLLTPFGLRTLSPDDRNYRPIYAPGDQTQRDGAYHQGTVWPWLIGAYIDAQRKIEPDSGKVREVLKDILSSMSNYGVGSIAEIFDGSSPYKPNGCIAQAWSVAEVLRVLKTIEPT
jgi:predicted glycogen debranching enzyme